MDLQTDKAQPGRAQAESAGDTQATSQQGSVGRLIGSCAVLALAILPFAAGVAWYGHSRFGMAGLAAAGIAAATCWLSGSLALVATCLGQRFGAALHGVLIGMFFRMGLPLVVGFVLQKSNPPLAEAGVFTMILALYLVALVTETLLSLQFVPRPIAARSSGHSANPIEVVGVQSR